MTVECHNGHETGLLRLENIELHPLLEQLLEEGKIRLEDKEVPGPGGVDLGLTTGIFIR